MKLSRDRRPSDSKKTIRQILGVALVCNKIADTEGRLEGDSCRFDLGNQQMQKGKVYVLSLDQTLETDSYGTDFHFTLSATSTDKKFTGVCMWDQSVSPYLEDDFSFQASDFIEIIY